MNKLELIKLYHTLTNQMGLDEEQRKEILFAWFGKTTSKELNISELKLLCSRLKEMRGETTKNEDMWRKRVLKVVFDYFGAMDKYCNIHIAKATACRAAKTTDFNKISVAKLQSLYNAFKYHAQAMNSVTEEAINIMGNKN